MESTKRFLVDRVLPMQNFFDAVADLRVRQIRPSEKLTTRKDRRRIALAVTEALLETVRAEDVGLQVSVFIILAGFLEAELVDRLKDTCLKFKDPEGGDLKLSFKNYSLNYKSKVGTKIIAILKGEEDGETKNNTERDLPRNSDNGCLWFDIESIGTIETERPALHQAS